MADKQLSGFEISQGEPLDIGAEACAQDLKRIISMIDEHLSQETYGDTYVRKRRISKRQATLMALDLDMSGLDGVADVETAAGSLDAKLHAIRTAVSEHCKTDTDDDELEEPELPLAVDWLSVPLEKGAHASVLLVPLPAVADVANHKDSLALLRDEYAVAAAITRTNLNELLKAWVKIAPDGATKQAAEAATDGTAGPMRKAWQTILRDAIRRAIAAQRQRGLGTKKRKGKTADVPASADALAMGRKALATARLNGEVLEDQHETLKQLSGLDHGLLAKRRKMQEELTRIREKQENGGFEQFAYRKPGNELMKPALLARWQAAQADLYELKLATVENASLKEQGLFKTLVERAERTMHLCDVEAHRGPTFLSKLREKQRNAKELKDLARNDEEGKNIEKLGAEIEAEEKKKLAESDSQRAMATQVAAIAAAVRQAVGAKRPRGAPQPAAGTSAPARKKSRSENRYANKPGMPGYSGCAAVLVATGKRCGGDHWASDHSQAPQKYGGAIKPAPPKSRAGGKAK
jgi:hypothetical protein